MLDISNLQLQADGSSLEWTRRADASAFVLYSRDSQPDGIGIPEGGLWLR
jgi:hypothetical protein